MTHPYRVCPKCSAPLDGTETFCAKCGRRFSGRSPGRNVARAIGIILAVIFGLYGLCLEMTTMNMVYGAGGAAIGFFFSPIIVPLAPIYWITQGMWMPAIIIYGGGLIAGLLFAAGGTEEA